MNGTTHPFLRCASAGGSFAFDGMDKWTGNGSQWNGGMENGMNGGRRNGMEWNEWMEWMEWI